MTLYPYHLGAGISVQHMSADFRHVKVRMGLGWYNRNYVGTQFGGSLYSMRSTRSTMLMLMENLGPTTLCGTRRPASTSSRRAKARCMPRFSIDDALLDEVRRQTTDGEVFAPPQGPDSCDGSGTLVARVDKTRYVRRKPPARRA